MSNETKKTALPKLRFPEFREAGEWVESKLGEVSEIVRGGSPRPIEDFITTDPDGLNWLKIGDVAPEAKYIFKTQQKVIREALSKTREVRPGDLILSNSMSFGRPYIMKTESCIHDGWIAIRHIAADVLTDYLYYAISSESSQTYFVANAAGAAVLNLNAERIKVLPLSIPSLSEQQKIAATLSSLDDLITAQNAKLAALQAHKRGLMQGLFPAEGETVPKLRFPEFQEAGEWEEKELGKLTKKVGSGITPTGGDKHYKTQGLPFVRSQNIGWGKLLLDDVAFIDQKTHATFPATEIKECDVLLNITGASIGRCAVADSSIAGGNVNQHVCIIRSTEELNPLFLSQYLISNGGQNQIDSFQAGGNRQGLNFVQIRSFQIPMPSTLEEQQKIAACLSAVDNRITSQIQKIEALKLHKKGLMQNLFPIATEPTI